MCSPAASSSSTSASSLYGVSAALILLSGLGNDPWDVLHQGLARQTGIGTGMWVCLVGALVLLAWIPLRQRPGLGTVSNVIVVGVVARADARDLFDPAARAGRALVLLAAGVVLNGVATGLYIGARFGPGPARRADDRHRRRGHSIRAVRTGIELTVLVVGVAARRHRGIGTLVYALGIGPLAHVFIPAFTVPERMPAPAPAY